MIAINSQILEDVYISRKTDIDNIIAAKKANVQLFLNTPTKIVNRRPQPIVLSADHQRYLRALLNDFERIARANSAALITHQGTFDGIINHAAMSTDPNKEFRNELLKRMGYKDLRDSFYPEYFELIGIKACVYCNSQLALTVRNAGGSKSAKFQVDHYLPKIEYPCFSISFYNLYPVCGPCNNSKSTNRVNFNLYSNNYLDFRKSAFNFQLDKKSLLKYRVNGRHSNLDIRFSEPVGSDFNRVFAIESIYNTQKDLAEELVIKSMIYNETYREMLRTALVKMYNDKAPMFERLLAGNYTDERDIHKRPMAKFIQDIARQLKLIK